MSDSESGDGPKQVSDPAYHSENHTAACRKTASAAVDRAKTTKT